MGSPILLLQWLRKDDKEHETQVALAKFAKEINITCADINTKIEVKDEISKWLKDNSNAQYLFIGTHGNQYGIGLSEKEFFLWAELWNFFCKLNTNIVLWLGACKSSYAANGWSPIKGYKLPIDYILGFRDITYTEDIKEILLKLLEMTRIDPIVFVEQEIPELRKCVPNTLVEMYYPASTLNGEYSYVNIDNFKNDVGLTFEEYMKKNSSSYL